jgi:RNA polymerase sigma-70 factor (ECF subfamily)
MSVRDSHDQSTEAEAERAVQLFLAERTRLLRVAYRVVGDAATAEDVVQDAWLRWQRVDKREVKNPAAWLTTATTHLAINVIQSARHRHETPTESPRIALVRSSDEPAEHVERSAAVEGVLAFLMAKLTSSELAAYVLRKCFEYPYDEIATILRTSTPNARQLVRRAQLSIAAVRMRPVDAGAHRRLATAFTAATVEGDLEPLERFLADRACRCSAPLAVGRRSGGLRGARSVRSGSSNTSPPAA